MSDKRGKIIAFCGLDGAGKSTLVDMLEKRGEIKGAVYVRKNTNRNIDLVRKYHRKYLFNDRDWLEGDFAHSAAFAACLDYLNHYDKNVKKWYRKKDYIICDRHAICYAAYLNLTGFNYNCENLFANVIEPDLYVYVDIPAEVAVERLRERGSGATEEESYEVLKKYRKAYFATLNKIEHKIVIDNNRDINATYKSLLEELKGHVSE